LGGVGAAAALVVNITDPALIAASSDGTPGSTGNLAVLSAVHDQPVGGGTEATRFLLQLVFKVGSDTANASADLDASQQILSQASGPAQFHLRRLLDEEASTCRSIRPRIKPPPAW